MTTKAILGAAVVVLTAAATARAGVEPKTLTEEQWNQVRPLFKLVEEVAAGAAAPADVGLAWQCYFLNAQSGVVFVPFTVSIQRGGFSSFPVAMYLRVVTRGAPAPSPGPRDALAQYPFEDAAIFDQAENGRISRAFAAPPGEYDVYVALTERTTLEQPRPKTVVLKQAVTVPDLQSHLAVSSIFLVEKVEIDPRNRRLNFEEQLDEPYAWWGTKMTPALRATFNRHEKLSVVFVVYNAGGTADDKPDVEVRYNFHRRTGAAESFFVTTQPEAFNAQTLRPEFSLTAGDLVLAGQEMPLSKFPDGNYRLEITVTDKVTRTSLARSVVFQVAGS